MRDGTNDFTALLSPHFQQADLEKSPSIVFGLWADFTIGYVNPAWTAFASENGGQPAIATEWGVGSPYFGAIPGSLRPFYERFLLATPDAGAARHPTSHVYECSSATVFRKFSMQVYALAERAGFIVTNALVVEAPHDAVARAPHEANREQYANNDGVIVQCSHCRLVQNARERARWDWVPAWVTRSPRQTSHGLCPVCFEYYYAAEA